MSNDLDAMLIFGAVESMESSGEAQRGLGDLVKDKALRASKVGVDTLQENMRIFLSQVDTVMSTSPKEIGGLRLEEIEIHAQIDGKGNVGLASLGGAEVALQGGIKFVLRKSS